MAVQNFFYQDESPRQSISPQSSYGIWVWTMTNVFTCNLNYYRFSIKSICMALQPSFLVKMITSSQSRGYIDGFRGATRGGTRWCLSISRRRIESSQKQPRIRWRTALGDLKGNWMRSCFVHLYKHCALEQKHLQGAKSKTEEKKLLHLQKILSFKPESINHLAQGILPQNLLRITGTV